jgi:DNA-binding response OmpR family regulator
MAGSLLLVDDEPAIRASLGEFFMGEGYQVAVAASEEEAFEVYRAQRPSVVVSDLNLAPGSGISLFQRLKRVDDGEAKPFCILMTGFGTMDNAVEALRSGADEYLTKPLQLKALQQAVDTGLARPLGLEAKNRHLGFVSGDRLGYELNVSLRRIQNDLQMLEEQRLGSVNEGQRLKLKAMQLGLLASLQSIKDLQGTAGRELEVYLEALEPEGLFRRVQVGFLADMERKGVSVVQEIPKSLPMVWTDRRLAAGLIELALCASLSLARSGGSVHVSWDQRGADPSLVFQVKETRPEGPLPGLWPSAAELQVFQKANLRVHADPASARISVGFFSAR